MNNENLIIHSSEGDFRNILQEEIQKALVKSGLTSKQKIDLAKELLTRKEVASMFSITLPTLEKWKDSGILPAPIKQGGKVFYLRSMIEKMIENHRKGGEGCR
jgi:predicted DNA-binding transcriptional regulator AlpA